MLFSKRPPSSTAKNEKASVAPPLDFMRQSESIKDDAEDTTIADVPAAPSATAQANNASLSALGHLVTLLSFAADESQHTLKDLQWLAMPAITLGQYALAHATADDGRQIPVAAVLWAFVSPETDKRLSDTTVDIVKLAPNEWRAGNTLWVTLLVASAEMANGFVDDIARKVFKNAPAKIRYKTDDGKITIGFLKAS